MDLNEIFKLLSQLFSNSTPNNNTNNSTTFKDFNTQNANIYHQQPSKPPEETNQINAVTHNNYPNYPPPLNQKITTQSYQNNIYPQNPSFENPPPQTSTPKPTENFNFQNMLSNFLSNPDSLNLIQKFLPLLQNQGSNSNNNILTSILSGFKKNKKESPQISHCENQEDSNTLIDIDKLIRIDDT